MKFSANLGFLWADRPLPEAIREAAAAGFDAVECHWPYDVSASQVRAALDDTGLGMLGWDRPIGAEYKPAGATAGSLQWLADCRAQQGAKP